MKRRRGLIKTPKRVRVVVEVTTTNLRYKVTDLQREVRAGLASTFTTGRYIKDGTEMQVKLFHSVVTYAVKNPERLAALPGEYE